MHLSFTRWDVRCRLLATVLLAFSFSFVTALHLLPVILAVALGFVWLARLSPKKLLARLGIPSLVIVAMVIFLPFFGGSTVLFEAGIVTVYQEGLAGAALIALRFYAIMILVFAVIGTLPLHATIRAMNSMGLPAIMADMAGLVLRYFHVLSDDNLRMSTAMRLRGYGAKPWSLSSLRTQAWLWGGLFLRSHERSQRVYRAMILRGYNLEDQPSQGFPQRRDMLLLGLALVVSGVIVFLQLQAGK
nr:cobalt ECF transporter T component CbiQ [Desulfurispira natronophila]